LPPQQAQQHAQQQQQVRLIMTGMLAKTFLQVKWFHERLKLGENAGANAGVKLRLLRTDAPDDMRYKSERRDSSTARPDRRSENDLREKQMSGRCAQNDEVPRGVRSGGRILRKNIAPRSGWILLTGERSGEIPRS
jgi:hypothetical protein